MDEFPIHPTPPGEYDGMKETSNLPEEVIHLMPDRVSPGPLCGNHPPKEAVCIHTRKVYDSCREGQEPFYRKKTGSRPGCMPSRKQACALPAKAARARKFWRRYTQCIPPQARPLCVAELRGHAGIPAGKRTFWLRRRHVYRRAQRRKDRYF